MQCEHLVSMSISAEQMCSEDPESQSQIRDAEDFKAYVNEWVSKVDGIIAQGMSH